MTNYLHPQLKYTLESRKICLQFHHEQRANMITEIGEQKEQ